MVNQLTQDEAAVLDTAVRRAAEIVSAEWPGIIGAEDLGQELWLEILERPSTQTMLTGRSTRERLTLLCRLAHRIAGEHREKNARFSRDVRYSVEEVKAALAGDTIWRELVDDLSAGLESLRERNSPYADAINARYFEGIVPDTQSSRDRLKNAHKALTEEVNRVVRTKFSRFEDVPGRSLGDGPGTKPRFPPRDVGTGNNVFDEKFRGEDMENYRGWTIPESYPEVRPAQLRNWHEDDREDFPQ